ncbi:hypothetical protein FB45DRAFT_1022677 [Roridomyces roridus]|uniref:F-box domain-containing protein n=1 Tax=Roridomyces roridus TaxID=1738132 RepID=A0AAD7C919_9AGAR|nr:hypothetical protein FB45DRAFT_1022677 [Roridomyces roridus]
MSPPLGLQDCPTELIHEIAKHSTRADLLSLAYVGDKDIYKICIPYQYETANIHSLAGFFQFCETVAMESNARLAACVRAVRFDTHKADAPSNLSTGESNAGLAGLSTDQAQACATGIANLHSLRSLELLHPLVCYIIPRIHNVVFSLLHTFAAPFSLHLDQFLRSNSQIQHLNIPSTGALQRTAQIPSGSIRLPHLRTFVGPEVLARAVMPHSRVTEPAVIWDPKPPAGRIRETLSCLVQSTAGIKGLRTHTYGWPEALLALIIEHFGTNLRVLEFRNYRKTPSRRSPRAFFATLVDNIHRFPELTTLLVHNAPHITAHNLNSIDKEAFEAEWNSIQTYYRLCPRLDDITLLSGVQWQRVAGERWIPVDGQALKKSKEFDDWFKGKFPCANIDEYRF